MDCKLKGKLLTRRWKRLREDRMHSPAHSPFLNLPEIAMQTNLSRPAPDVHTLMNEPININEDASIDYWLAALRCSELELRMAVAQVGTGARDVGTELGRVV
jgi:hypothetical protein